MPPGAVVPVHHDTGAWVAQSHRMHIPIFTDPSVAFEVGAREQSLARYDFQQGRLYELNNASKHRVENHWDQHRVHLIFDYVEPAFPLAHFKLTPDMVLHQTRRTLDLSTDYGTRPTPSFLVIGAQKAGTTSLYDYITQHDLVVPAKRKETHYFDWRWNAALPPSGTPEGDAAHAAYYLNFFEKDVLLKCPSLLSGEATPSYLLGGSRVIRRVQHVVPHCRKILAILRDPVERAYSHYCMTADTTGTPEQLRNRGHHHLAGQSFEQLVDAELDELTALGVHPDMDADEFDERVLCARATFTNGAHSYVLRGLYALQLAGWLRAYGGENVLLLTLDEMKTSEGLHVRAQGLGFFRKGWGHGADAHCRVCCCVCVSRQRWRRCSSSWSCHHTASRTCRRRTRASTTRCHQQRARSSRRSTRRTTRSSARSSVATSTGESKRVSVVVCESNVVA